MADAPLFFTKEMLELHDRLLVAKAQYEANTATGIKDEQKRLAALGSLHAVIDFLRNTPGCEGLDFGLRIAMEGIADVENRHSPSWLQRPSGGRPALTDRQRACRARIAGVLEFLMSKGYQQPAAAKAVYKWLSKEALAALANDQADLSWKTIVNWRDGAKKDESAGLDDGYSTTPRLMVTMAGKTEQVAKDTITAIERALLTP